MNRRRHHTVTAEDARAGGRTQRFLGDLISEGWEIVDVRRLSDGTGVEYTLDYDE